jgi:hypothetical protein
MSRSGGRVRGPKVACLDSDRFQKVDLGELELCQKLLPGRLDGARGQLAALLNGDERLAHLALFGAHFPLRFEHPLHLLTQELQGHLGHGPLRRSLALARLYRICEADKTPNSARGRALTVRTAPPIATRLARTIASLATAPLARLWQRDR